MPDIALIYREMEKADSEAQSWSRRILLASLQGNVSGVIRARARRDFKRAGERTGQPAGTDHRPLGEDQGNRSNDGESNIPA